MLRRDIDSYLADWKASPKRKPLVIKGPRQIGKTFSVREFAKRNYEDLLELNFVESPSFISIFDGDLDVNSILASIQLYTSFKSAPKSGRTLIFLDEVQACPRAIAALKFFALDGRFDVIASGSLLGVNYAEVPSYPTGHAEYVNMYPLSFKEFLYAKGVTDELIALLKKSFDDLKPVNEAINAKILEYFREYIIVGGMPEAVEDYVTNSNLAKVRSIQKNILVDYRNDIAKYTKGNEKAKAVACFDSIPAQLARENKKFRYSQFDKKGKAEKYAGSIKWLVDEGVANIAKKVNALETPLSGYVEEGYFKLYVGDTGLLVSMLDEGTDTKIIQGELGLYKGGIYENVVAQMIKATDHDLYFYTRNDTLELDFLLSKAGEIRPIEVNTGNNKAKSLLTILKENKDMVGFKLINGNVGVKDNMITMPLYMAMFL